MQQLQCTVALQPERNTQFTKWNVRVYFICRMNSTNYSAGMCAAYNVQEQQLYWWSKPCIVTSLVATATRVEFQHRVTKYLQHKYTVYTRCQFLRRFGISGTFREYTLLLILHVCFTQIIMFAKSVLQFFS